METNPPDAKKANIIFKNIELAGILKGPKSAQELITESRKNVSRYDSDGGF